MVNAPAFRPGGRGSIPARPEFFPPQITKANKNSNKYEIQNEFLNQFLYDIPDFIEVKLKYNIESFSK